MPGEVSGEPMVAKGARGASGSAGGCGRGCCCGSTSAEVGLVGARGVNHIGIAVKSLAEQRSYYEGVLGARFEGEEDVPEQNVRVAFFALGQGSGVVRLELLEPTSPESPIAKFIEKKGEGVHHVAYTVEGIEARLAALKAGGVALIDESPRTGAHGAKIAFVHPKSTRGVLTELCEPRHGA